MSTTTTTTSQNVAFISRPTFDSSLEENVDQDFYFDDDFEFDKNDADDFLPSFKTVVLNGSNVTWTKKPESSASPRSDSELSDSVFKFSNFLGSHQSIEVDENFPTQPNFDLREASLNGGGETAKSESGETETSPPSTPADSRIGKFYDFQTCNWVDVDNFAFSGEVNHFSDDPSNCDEEANVMMPLKQVIIKMAIFGFVYY